MALNKLKENINHCFRCGYCCDMTRPITGTYGVCPVVEELKFEHYSARGRVSIARGILEGALDYDEKLIQVLYTCMGCGLCKEVCPLYDWAKVDTPLIIRALHQDIFEKSFKIPESLEQGCLNMEKEGNPLGRKRAERLAWTQGLNMPTEGENLLFAGCDFSYEQPKTIQRLVNMLKKAGIDLTVLKNESCCGYPALWTGNVPLARKMATNNIKAIENACAKNVVTLCPGCHVTLKFDYPDLIGKKINFEVLHITQVLASLIDENLLRFEGIAKKATYHDPCQLVRRAGIYEEPRKVLKSIPLIELAEPLRSAQNAWCCGGGGLVPLVSSKLSLKIASSRAKELADTEADTVITACPYCLKMLKLALRGFETKIEAYYITDFLSLRHL